MKLLEIFKPVDNLGSRIRLKGFTQLYKQLLKKNKESLLQIGIQDSDNRSMKSILEIEDIPNLLDIDDRGNTIIHLITKANKFDIDVLNKILVKIRKQFATEAEFLTIFHLRNKDNLSAYEYCQFTKNVDYMSILE